MGGSSGEEKKMVNCCFAAARRRREALHGDARAHARTHVWRAVDLFNAEKAQSVVMAGEYLQSSCSSSQVLPTVADTTSHYFLHVVN